MKNKLSAYKSRLNKDFKSEAELVVEQHHGRDEAEGSVNTSVRGGPLLLSSQEMRDGRGAGMPHEGNQTRSPSSKPDCRWQFQHRISTENEEAAKLELRKQ